MSRELSFANQENLPTVPLESWIVPAVVTASGDDVANRFIEFFVVAIRNGNTRRSYATAVRQFCAWLETYGVKDLTVVQPMHVAAYIEELGASLTRPSVTLHLAAIKRFFAFLVTGGVLRRSPAMGADVFAGDRLDASDVDDGSAATAGRHSGR